MIGLMVVIVICATLFGVMYVYCCSKNKVGAFEVLRYKDTIFELRKRVAELELKAFERGDK